MSFQNHQKFMEQPALKEHKVREKPEKHRGLCIFVSETYWDPVIGPAKSDPSHKDPSTRTEPLSPVPAAGSSSSGIGGPAILGEYIATRGLLVSCEPWGLPTCHASHPTLATPNEPEPKQAAQRASLKPSTKVWTTWPAFQAWGTYQSFHLQLSCVSHISQPKAHDRRDIHSQGPEAGTCPRQCSPVAYAGFRRAADPDLPRCWHALCIIAFAKTTTLQG